MKIQFVRKFIPDAALDQQLVVLLFNKKAVGKTYCFAYLKTDPNFDTNAPPFELRGCKVILRGAFWGQGVQIEDTKYE